MQTSICFLIIQNQSESIRVYVDLNGFVGVLDTTLATMSYFYFVQGTQSTDNFNVVLGHIE